MTRLEAIDETSLDVVTGAGQWKTYNSAAADRAISNGALSKQYRDPMGGLHTRIYEPNFVERFLQKW